MKSYHFLFLTLFLLNKIVFANHYRGVVSSSEWLDNDLFYFKAQFYYRLKDNGAGSFVKCDDQLISSKTIKKDESTFSLAVYKCNQFEVCGNALFFLENSFICNSYSIHEDWSIVDKLEKVNIKSNDFQEGDSIVAKLFTAYGEWSDLPVRYAWTHFSRKVKNKNNNWNHPPSTKTFPKYNLIKGCETKLQIPVDDIDDDTVRCRPSLKSAGECVNCNFKPAYLDQETCTIVFPANVTEPLIIEIQIEDFSNKGDVKPMSSVPLQFMVTLTLAHQNCNDYLIFTSVVPPDNSCNAIAEKTQYNNRFEFNSTSNVTDVFLNAFDGFIKGSLNYSLDYNLWFFNYSVIARSSNVTQESITVYAKNAEGYSSEIRKLQYVLNYIPPSIIDVYPLGDICQKTADNYNWTFTTNRNVSSPEKTSYIKFMKIENENSLKLAYQFNMLTLNKNNFDSFILSVPISQLELNKNYSILIDFGAIITLDYCKPQSRAVNDLKKYQFKIIGELSKEVTFLKLPPRYTKGFLLKLEWKFLTYGKKSDCLIMYKNAPFYDVLCNETSLELHNQPTGQYNFQVRYSTKCSASLLSAQISWFVVNEKPIVEVTTLNLINGYASNSFTVIIKCNHVLPCNILCKFSTKDKINFQNFENCLSTFKPDAQLVHLEYYVLQVYAKDEAENEANIVKVEFIADTKPPQFKNAIIEL
nr:uncharacterized protein LOC124815106 [Hydra vulgaris]